MGEGQINSSSPLHLKLPPVTLEKRRTLSFLALVKALLSTADNRWQDCRWLSVEGYLRSKLAAVWVPRSANLQWSEGTASPHTPSPPYIHSKPHALRLDVVLAHSANFAWAAVSSSYSATRLRLFKTCLDAPPKNRLSCILFAQFPSAVRWGWIPETREALWRFGRRVCAKSLAVRFDVFFKSKLCTVRLTQSKEETGDLRGRLARFVTTV